MISFKYCASYTVSGQEGISNFVRFILLFIIWNFNCKNVPRNIEPCFTDTVSEILQITGFNFSYALDLPDYMLNYVEINFTL